MSPEKLVSIMTQSLIDPIERERLPGTLGAGRRGEWDLRPGSVITMVIEHFAESISREAFREYKEQLESQASTTRPPKETPFLKSLQEIKV